MPSSPAGIHLQLEQPVVADPWRPVVLDADLSIRGWVFADGGVDRLEVLIDAQPVAVLATGIVREDVMAALGGRDDALRSGFEARVPFRELAGGKHLVEVRATDCSGATRAVQFFIEVAPGAKPHRVPKRSKPIRGSRRAVFIDAATPTPDQDAGSNVALAHMALLQSLGYAVTFVPESLLPSGNDTERLIDLGIEPVHRPDFRSLEEFLSARGATFDLAYVHRYTVGEVAIPLLREHAPRARVIFNNADLHYLRMQREARVLRDRQLAEAAKRVKARELAVIRSADCTLLCNSHEIDLVRRELPKAKLSYLPWVIEAASAVPGNFAGREGIMYLGGFGHRPNQDAVKFFVREVMPRLRRKLPGARLHVYGSKIPREIEALAASDVIIEGYAPDLDAVFERHRLSIAPLRFGAGFKGKLAESLAHGVPAVASSIAAEGTGLTDGKQVLVADGAPALAAAVAKLYRDEKLWRRLSQAGWRYVKSHYSAARGQQVLRAILKRR